MRSTAMSTPKRVAHKYIYSIFQKALKRGGIYGANRMVLIKKCTNNLEVKRKTCTFVAMKIENGRSTFH